MAHVECDKCLPAAWKYRAPGGKKDSAGALYDLTTNPEENPKKDGRLNCFDPSPTGGTGKIYDTQLCLAKVASDWIGCVGNRPGPHCEPGALGNALPAECEASPPP